MPHLHKALLVGGNKFATPLIGTFLFKKMTIKDILPFENYVIKSKLSVEQINLRLNENIEPKSKSIFSIFTRNATKPYEGEFYGNRFKMSRIISYRNSFLPIISGDISTFKGLTYIKIKMETNRIVLVLWYLIVFIVGFGMTSFGKIFNSIQNKDTFPFGGYEFLIFIAIFLITPLIAFKIESRKSKKYLSTLFEKID